mmetsp:Transcript_80949/g.262184  ORF Transcript_80949/g.262184 Transcript_80949/m.262184 type:complete len:302 (+) Transcript_80949:113-1018(+)
MGGAAASWPKGLDSLTVVVGLAVEYCMICGLASFFLGPTAFLLSSLVLLLQFLIAAETLDQRHPSATWILLAWVVTAVMALLVGGRNYHALVAPYSTAKAGRSYPSVPVSATAVAHADAGILYFEKGVTVDDTRSVGLRIFGSTYCVAPVLSGEPSTQPGIPGPEVQFWAVGLDCCGARGGFDCDDSGNSEAHGGVVLHGPEEGEEAASRKVLAPRILHEGYSRAVEAACALYDLQTVESPILLRWVVNADRLLNRWFAGAVMVWIVSSVLYCMLVGVVWFLFINRARRKPGAGVSKPLLP